MGKSNSKDKKEKEIKGLWDDIDPDTFINEDNIDDKDIGEYNTEKMKLYALNVICARHLTALEDSLKPVQRRILYVMYLNNAYKNNKKKSSDILGQCLKYHPHGDGSVYKTMIGMGQKFKTPQKLITGVGGFGTIIDPNMYAHYRYTEAFISDYAYECFFEDYDQDCVEMKETNTKNMLEPVYLPSKFPNVLINGVTAVTIGYLSSIPPYNISDIATATKKLLKNPDANIGKLYPDLPTGCELVELGPNKFKMRSNIEIIDNGNTWNLKVTSIPWLMNLPDIIDKLSSLTKSGFLPIKEVQNSSYSYKEPNSKYNEISHIIDLNILISKSYDPYEVKTKILKNVLEKPLNIGVYIIKDGLNVKSNLSIKDILLCWIDTRREYLRRLLNKRVSKAYTRLVILDILIKLTDKNNLEKTVNIIRNSNDDELIHNLAKHGDMNTYQAKSIAEMNLKAFTKNSHDRYIEEEEKLKKQIDKTLEIIKSEKRIDEIIFDDLNALNKYAEPRRSIIVNNNDEEIIHDTNCNCIFSKKGYVKKIVIDNNKSKGCGVYIAGDYPSLWTIVNNKYNITIFDNNAKMSVIPVSSIPNTASSDLGNPVYKLTRLTGSIVSAFPAPNEQDLAFLNEAFGNTGSLLTLSSRGYIKRSNIDDILVNNDNSYTKNIRVAKYKDNDSLACAGLILDNENIIVYSKKGRYSIVPFDEIPLLNKDTQGNISIDIPENDSLAGFCVIPKDSTHLLILTKNGSFKKLPLTSLRLSKKKDTSNLVTFDSSDEIHSCKTIKESSQIVVCTKLTMYKYTFDEIKETSKRAKCVKTIPIGNSDIIIDLMIN